MPTLSITKSYADDSVLTEDQLDDLKDSIETFVNTTKLGADNLQDSAVGTSQLASTSVTTAKIANNAVTDAKLASSGSTDADRAVGTNHIKDDAVTNAKIADDAVDTAQIADGAVETAQINDGAVTAVKLAALGQQLSSSSGSFTTSSGSFTDVTNLSVSITTYGRPVFVGLVADGSYASGSELSYLQALTGRVQILRGSTEICRTPVNATNGSQSGFLPPSSVSHVDVVAAGTYTYKVQVLTGTGSIAVEKVKLLAFEL